MKASSLWSASPLGALLAGSAALFSPAPAAAQDCASGVDCGAGYRCQIDSYQSCDYTCPDDGGGDCMEVPETCRTETYGYCTNATCTADADCPSRMACQAQTQWVCDGGGTDGGAAGGPPSAGSGSSCSPDEPCTEPVPMEPSSCHEEPGDSVCIPRHQLPCDAGSSDCGEGFDCVESSYLTCGGMGSAGAGGGAAPADAGVADEEPPPTVPSRDGGFEGECWTESYTSCQLQDLPCSTDADCPADMGCHDQYVWLPCTGAAGSGGDDGMFDAGVVECPEPTLQRRCMPPEYEGGGTPPPGGGDGGNTADGGTSMGPSDPSDEEGESSGGSAGASAAGSGGGASPPDAPGGGADEDEGSDEGRGHGRGLLGFLKHGCSSSGPIGSGPLASIAFGVLGLILRRRTRA